jgi:CubicO group peptidase (beta-lactamase class C family)
MREALAAVLAAAHISGVALVARDGTPVFAHAYGLANRATHTRNRLDTQFNLASVGKMFTGVAVAQLVERGRLKFSDPVGRYVPGLPNRVARDVTVGELLDHTSGLGDYFADPGYDTLRPRLRSLAAYLPLISHEQPAFRPGTQFSYSNSGFILAGLVVERVSHEPFPVYLRRHVWGPAGMRHTTCAGGLRSGRAIGYTDYGTANTTTLPPNGTSAGGCYSTAGDMVRFAEALIRHRLLDARTTRVVTSAHVAAPGGGYGYGFGIRRGTLWHNGGAPGVATEIDIDPRTGLVAIVLENRDPTHLRRAMSAVRRALHMP